MVLLRTLPVPGFVGSPSGRHRSNQAPGTGPLIVTARSSAKRPSRRGRRESLGENLGCNDDVDASP